MSKGQTVRCEVYGEIGEFLLKERWDYLDDYCGGWIVRRPNGSEVRVEDRDIKFLTD